MRKLFLSVILTAFSAIVFGQTKTDTVKIHINDHFDPIEQLRTELEKDRAVNYEQSRLLDSLKNVLIQFKTEKIVKEKSLSELSEQANESLIGRLDSLEHSVSKNTLYSMIGGILFALISLMIFMILRKQISKEKAALSKHIDEEAIKLDTKLVEVLEAQLSLLKEERTSSPSQNQEIDHSLALKVADEIVKMQTNLSRMDEETRGRKHLVSSIIEIKNSFETNGYEIVEMLGKTYDSQMRLIATFRPDDNLLPGQQIITGIKKAQVNYKGEMIQAAQIEVSQGD